MGCNRLDWNLSSIISRIEELTTIIIILIESVDLRPGNQVG